MDDDINEVIEKTTTSMALASLAYDATRAKLFSSGIALFCSSLCQFAFASISGVMLAVIRNGFYDAAHLTATLAAFLGVVILSFTTWNVARIRMRYLKAEKEILSCISCHAELISKAFPFKTTTISSCSTDLMEIRKNLTEIEERRNGIFFNMIMSREY